MLVNFRETAASNGKIIAIAELNAPKSLNAISLPMVNQLYHQLNVWKDDSEIALVVIEGTGDKAFCAGGDVVSLYHDLKSREFPISDIDIEQTLAYEFFNQEYQLDQLIHNYPKPILAWANGYVMGGGIGLVAGASHKVTTENTTFAMPEVTIGLYPDVGASYFLNQMPDQIGLFLGITGATFNASDASKLGLSDHFIEHSKKASLMSELKKIDWGNNPEINEQLLSNFLDEQSKSSNVKLPTSLIEEHKAEIASCFESTNINDIVDSILAMETDSSWFNKVKDKLSAGSPLSVAITHRLLNENKGLSLAECFEVEGRLSKRCSQFTEFNEGVRALLVDKDRTPNWTYKSLNQIDPKRLDWFFS